ncbi:carboxylesterase family protein [Altererythrobacter halimionae]|uniref:Carboxylesterase family protein n=2 Tax=Alteriqipengyuania halimionae TaxID=1926630 RepID=A0A6I4U211_9SPHN|nr:carboxylesterase family protein [Alteriqipengyuania halimionae]
MSLAGCSTTGAVDAGAAETVASDSPVLSTSLGPVRGTTSEAGDVMIFRGVRYGASTEGMRFQEAADPEPWRAARDATEFGPDCPQRPSGDVPVFASWVNDLPQSEDCLFLNVWTRGTNDGKKRPIMVWLHGGGYVTGSGSSHGYDGTRLAQRGDVVVVTINHRLNGFGYLYLGGVSGDPKYAHAGNLGSLDAIKALEWVRDNAAAIGGDPDNVTIFGESGGAAKVSTLMAMEAADGLFDRAIAQSGSMSLAGFEPRLATALTKNIFETAGLEPGDVEGLAALPMEDYVKVLMKSRTRAAYFRPVVDGSSLTRQPFSPDATPVSADIPLLVGTNRTEMRLQAGLADPGNFSLAWDQLPEKIAGVVGDADADQIIAGMRAAHPDADASEIFFQTATFQNYRGTALRQAERKSAQNQAPVYMYRLDWETPVAGGILKSPHALDIAFVFDNVARSTSYTGTGPDQQRMADLMSEAWIAFAKTGNPNTPVLPQWPRYTQTNRATMIFDTDPEVVLDPDKAERELLQSLLSEGRSQ